MNISNGCSIAHGTIIREEGSEYTVIIVEGLHNVSITNNKGNSGAKDSW